MRKKINTDRVILNIKKPVKKKRIIAIRSDKNFVCKNALISHMKTCKGSKKVTVLLYQRVTIAQDLHLICSKCIMLVL